MQLRSIVYLASYPRSGNTFLRALLANYMSGRARSLTAQQIALFGFGEKSEDFWSRCTGLQPERLTKEAVWQARASYFALTRQLPGTGAVMFKTHTLNGSAFDTPAFAFEKQDRIIYIVRHPLDVTVSCAHFFGLSPEDMANRMRLKGAFNGGTAATFELTGSWSEHVIGWLNERRCPILIVRYRDLRMEPASQLRRVLRFLGIPVSGERVMNAVRHSNFQHLQATQVNEGFYQGPSRDPKSTFFRVGEVGQWRTALPPALAKELERDFAELIDMFDFERTV